MARSQADRVAGVHVFSSQEGAETIPRGGAGLAEFLDFSTRFRRLAIWNARMAYIQRPGARIIASEFEWETVGRHVLPDAVPIIILWPFSPIRFVYELQDTGPPIDRESINDPFGAKGEFPPATISALMSNLKKQKSSKTRGAARLQWSWTVRAAFASTPNTTKMRAASRVEARKIVSLTIFRSL
jgi:hypothetical protein